MSRKKKKNQSNIGGNVEKLFEEKKSVVTGFTRVVKNSNVLDVKVKNYGECAWCKDESEIVLKISWEIWSRWLYISSQMKGKEWGGIFSVEGDNITNFKLPEQEVGSVEVEFKEDLVGDGVVHSHHGMKAFHSNQDDHHCRNLYKYSIVLSDNDGYEATKRLMLPCGGWGYIGVKLEITDKPILDMDKIKEKSVTFNTYKPYSCNPPYKYEYNKVTKLLGRVEVKNDVKKEDVKETSFEDDDLSLFNPCDECLDVKCKNCLMTLENGLNSETPPFCLTCDSGHCETCDKLDRYLQEYPEESEFFKGFTDDKPLF